MPWADKVWAEVEPDMNHSSSAMTARRKTRLVVSRGRISLLSDVDDRENLNGGGAKIDLVPVPVLFFPCREISLWLAGEPDICQKRERRCDAM